MQCQQQRPAAWPLALSLAAHMLLVLLWWRQAPVPATLTATAPRAPMVWLRLAAAPAAPAVATPPAAAPARRTQRSRPAVHPMATPAPADKAPTGPAATTEMAQASEASPPVTAPVTGVGFGPPRWSLPFGGAGAGAVFGSRKQLATTSSTVPPTPIAAVAAEPAGAPRDQVLRALEAQIASWTAPADAQPAQCRLVAEPAAHSGPEPECDSLALAQALAERLPTLREALGTLRRLGPDVPRSGINVSDAATLVIAFADGRYRLQLSSR